MDPSNPFLKFGPIRRSVDPRIPLFSNSDQTGGPRISAWPIKIRTDSSVRGCLHPPLEFFPKPAVRGSLNPIFKIRTDSAVPGSLHLLLKIRTKPVVRGSLQPFFLIRTKPAVQEPIRPSAGPCIPFRSFSQIGGPWIHTSLKFKPIYRFVVPSLIITFFIIDMSHFVWLILHEYYGYGYTSCENSLTLGRHHHHIHYWSWI